MKRFVVALLALLAGLAFSEVLIRITGLASPPATATVDESGYQTLPGIFVPSPPRMNRSHPRLPHTISINSLGYRGREISRAKPQGETRILFVGDSSTFGDFVEDDETIPAYLEGMLSSRCEGIRVVNAGVPGTTIDAHLEMVQRGMEIHPDMVLLMFFENDLLDLVPPTIWSQIAENRTKKSRLPYSIVYGVLRHTALSSLARKTITGVRQRQGGGGVAVPEDGSHDPLDDLKAIYIEKLEQMAHSLEEHGIPLVVTSFPSHLTLYGLENFGYLEWLEQEVERLGIRYIDLAHVLNATGRSQTDLYYLPWDGHPTPEGYRTGAGELTKRLLELAQGADLDGCI